MKSQRLSLSIIGNARQKFHRTMSTGATRAATASTARDVKRKLIKLLFREEHGRTGSNHHARLDVPVYSHGELRRAYLKRLQVIHPDKINANCTDVNRAHFGNRQHPKNVIPLPMKCELKIEFLELQSIWDKYEELSKSTMKVIQGAGATANFTKFGVGCSFSDNEEEKALRKEITDQACRGWFASGLVSSGPSIKEDVLVSSKVSNRVEAERKSLIDDSIFIQVELCDKFQNSGASRGESKAKNSLCQKRTLVPGIN